MAVAQARQKATVPMTVALRSSNASGGSGADNDAGDVNFQLRRSVLQGIQPQYLRTLDAWIYFHGPEIATTRSQVPEIRGITFGWNPG
jgi:hypothetical protein